MYPFRQATATFTVSLIAVLATACAEYGMTHDMAGSTWASEPMAESPPEPEGTEPACLLDAPVTLWVSPDDSNSMSSPVQAREQALADGSLWTPIRTWEFFNYATWDYAPASAGGIDVDLQLAAGATPGDFTLQVGIASEAVDPAERPPMVLTFSVDQSGSMSGAPIQRMKQTLRVIAGQLRAGDIVSLIGWSTNQDVMLEGHTVKGPDDLVLLTAIDTISTDGGTDLAAGLRAAYRITEDHYVPGRIHRVVLMSDGGANIGVTDAELIGSKAGGLDEDGIYLIGVGTGSAEAYNDYLMNNVTDLGRGAAVFIPSDAEAERMFGERFLETMATSARDVQIRYDLPPGFELVRFSGEEVSTDPREVQPQHLAPNDAMVLHQQLHTCDEAVDLDQTVTVTVSYLDGVDFTPREAVASATLAELLDGDTTQLQKGAAIFAYAETLKHVRGDTSQATPGEARATLDAARALLPDDTDLAEVDEVLTALGI